MRSAPTASWEQSGWAYDSNNATWRAPAAAPPITHVHSLSDLLAGVLPANLRVPAEDVAAGNFGANFSGGNYVFPGTLDVTNVFRAKLSQSGGPASNRFWDGLEIAHASSTPYIDFHRSSNPEEATDYDMRIINDLGGFLRVYGGILEVNSTAFDNLRITGANCNIRQAERDNQANFWALYSTAASYRFWDSVDSSDRLWIDRPTGLLHGFSTTANCNWRLGHAGYGSGFVEFSNEARQGVGVYSYLSASDGTTYINATTGHSVFFRTNNVDAGIVDTGGAGFSSTGGVNKQSGVAMNLTSNGDIAWHWAAYAHTYLDRTGSIGFRWWDTAWGEIFHVKRGGGNPEVLIPSAPTLAGGNCAIPASGQLGFQSSSKRFKHDVKDDPLVGDDNPIWRMKHKRFRWDPETVMNAEEYHRQHDHDVAGLIAEEVYAIAPHLVHLDAYGRPQALDQWGLIAYLIDAVQHLKGKK